jgi:hypothetical protein
MPRLALLISIGLAAIASPRVAAAGEAGTRVEYKVLLQPSQLSKVSRLLDFHPSDHWQRSMYFFDDKAHSLFDNGVVLRLRINRGAPDLPRAESTAKIRPLEEENIKRKWRKVDGYKYEYDRVGRRDLGSASFTSEVGKGRLKKVMSKRRANRFRKLFDGDQNGAIEHLANLEVDWDSLKANGPVPATVWRVRRPDLVDRPITLELWHVGSRSFLELSVKDDISRIDEVARIVQGWLRENRIAVAAKQGTKTAAVLSYFAAKGGKR